MRRLAVLLPTVLLAACALPFGTAPRAPAAPAEPDAARAACVAEADRIVQMRERGQVMRADETESGFRTGTITVAPGFRAETDRALARLDRDRIVEECLRGAPAGAARAPG